MAAQNKSGNKVVWITGGGSGIGRSLALEYAKTGWLVVISGRREDALKETQALGQQECIQTHRCDVTKEFEVYKTVEWIENELGRLDLVIANAGYAQSGWFTDLSLNDWHRQFGVNFFGLISTVQAALPLLKQSKGQVVLMSSVMAYVRFSKSSAYCASKAAVTALGETLQLELDSFGVSCSIVHPGFVESEIGQINDEGRFDASLTDKRPTQFMWDTPRAARVMKRQLDKRKSHITITGHGKIGEFCARHFPRLVLWLQRRFM